MMPELRAVFAAFLTAVLLCDLSFDLPVWRAPDRDPVALGHALDAMTRYYGRITAKGSLLAPSVSLVMVGMFASLGYELISGTTTGFARFAIESSLAVGPIVLAGTRTFPHARRLATGEGDTPARTKLARGIARDHVVALPSMLLYLVIQLARV